MEMESRQQRSLTGTNEEEDCFILDPHLIHNSSWIEANMEGCYAFNEPTMTI